MAVIYTGTKSYFSRWETSVVLHTTSCIYRSLAPIKTTLHVLFYAEVDCIALTLKYLPCIVLENNNVVSNTEKYKIDF